MDMREMQARQIVERNMFWSAGAGVVPVPGVDLALLAGVQVKMLAQLAKHYNVPFLRNTVKALVGTLLGTLTAGGASVGLVPYAKMVPVVGNILGALTMPAFSAAATWALGKVFIQHFEAGGTFLNFNPDDVKEYFRQEFEKKTKGDVQAEPEAQPAAA